MKPAGKRFDLLVIGAGPAGQKAAVQGAKAGCSVLLVERDSGVGGECVHRGTIPSKTLRESAVYLAGLRRRAAELIGGELGPDTKLESLMRRLDNVLERHRHFMGEQLERNGIELWRGRARFVSPREVDVACTRGATWRASAGVVIVATGSRPRRPPEVPVDHERILDSDSILSMPYLPGSLTVLGAGVIASEFASIFQTLGVRVTMIDRGEQPLPFLDAELTGRFVSHFERDGGRFVPCSRAARVVCDPLGPVETTLDSGVVVRSEKVLVALGRTACVQGLGLEAAGVAVNERGFITVDEHCRTSTPSVYAVGDVIGPPALAASSMEQGRRAVRHALGLELGPPPETVPIGVYTIPEMASVGLSEADVVAREGAALVGRSRFAELARGQINGDCEGLLKLVADPSGTRLLGAQIVGEGATELIHLAQLALIGRLDVDAFVDNIFNFPTLAEGYRVAALEIAGKRAGSLRAAG